MHHIRTYFRIMEDAKCILRDYGMFPNETDPGYKAAAAIYETAFRQLIQEGIRLEYENGKAVIRTDGETFELRISRDDRNRMPVEHRGYVHAADLEADQDPGSEPADTDALIRKADAAIRRTKAVQKSSAAEWDYQNSERSDCGAERERYVAAESGIEEFDEEDEDMAAPVTEPEVGVQAIGEEAAEELADDYGMEETIQSVRESETETGAEGSAEMSNHINGCDTDDQRSITDEENAVREKNPPGEPSGDDEDNEGYFNNEDETGFAGRTEEAVQNDPDGGEEYNADMMGEMETQYDPAPAAVMPDHMHKKDFTFNFSEVSIKGGNNNNAEAQMITAPLSISDESPRILVCMIGESFSRTMISESSSCKVRIKGYPLEVRGRMEGDTFKTSCILPKHYIDEGTRIEVKTREFGKKGHIALEDKEENVQIHILPATFDNNKDGTADYIYYIFNNGEETVGDTGSGKAAALTYGGKEYEVLCKWNEDGVLYSSVLEKMS